ncbi:MAG: 2-hydroxychromene-2-carboxylate isomerase [Betaproteobacteria bacterium]|nr:2-hydroxychromene-2-carboxylate isomerase [Betaproteobacteria bacterium]
MAAAIDFYFDFSSPYGYLAATKIEALAAKHGRCVNWRPMLLGAAMKVTGGLPLPQIPLKGDYARRDFVRSARFHGAPFRVPSSFPISTVPAVRAFYWAQAKDPVKSISLAKALYKAYFADDADISRVEEVIRVATDVGFNSEEVAAGIGDQAVKDKTKAEVDAAIGKGVFGSPFIIIDGEPFWGIDRFDQIEKWLATGGW